MAEKAQTILEIMARLDMNDEKTAQRVASPEYQSLIRKAFREWAGAESEEKRKLVQDILANAAATRITSDDVVRMLIRLTPKHTIGSLTAERDAAMPTVVLPRADLPFPGSLPEFQRRFPDDAACAAYLEAIRWRDGFVCGWCGEANEPYRFANRPQVLRCRKCQRDNALTAGTVMERTRTPLSVWFWAAYLVSAIRQASQPSNSSASLA